MIEIRDVKKRFLVGGREVWALDGVSLDIGKGEFVALKGPSGSGKSTLLNVIGLLDVPTAGTFSIDGERLGDKSARERAESREKYLGFVFQSYNLIPELTVFENVEIPLVISRKKTASYRDHVMKLIEDVGLKDHVKHRPGELSGGQQQRVAIARALVRRPPLVVADEPTANLDSKTGLSIIEMMKNLNKSYGVTFVFATHDEGIIPFMDKVFYLVDGRVSRVEKRVKETV